MSKRGLSLISSLISPETRARKKQLLAAAGGGNEKDGDKKWTGNPPAYNDLEKDLETTTTTTTLVNKAPANKFVDRIVTMLPVVDGDTIGLHVLEVLSRMDFYQNLAMRDALKDTEICRNLCQLLSSKLILTEGKEEIVLKIITLIVDLTQFDKGYFSGQFAHCDCIALLIHEMQEFPENETLQETACRAIDNISSYVRYLHNHSADEPSSVVKQLFNDAVHNAVNLQTFNDTMKKYPGNRSIHENIIACLYVYLVINKKEDNQTFIKDLLMTMGFMELIYEALDTNVDDENIESDSLIKMCLLIIKIMAQYETQTRIFLREKDGVFTLATIISQFHPSNTHNRTAKNNGEETIQILNLALEVLQIVYDNTETNNET